MTTAGKSDEPRAGPASDHAVLFVGIAFAVSAVSGVTLLVVYALGGQTQIEGILLFGSLGGLGLGIGLWGQRLLPARIHIEPRAPVGSPPEALDAIGGELADETDFGRRRVLVLSLLGALGGLAAALAIPVLSLGPAPGVQLGRTRWRSGARLATSAGTVKAADIALGGVLTVFPDGDASDPNAATLLIHLDVARPSPPIGAPVEFVAYSKLCTHAGCPVGLYRSADHILICPCHQSQFDVLRGAAPISGPAARPLPELPIRQLADGSFVAVGDFPEPVGPSFWNMDR